MSQFMNGVLPNYLEVVVGSMYSGKSTYCMRKLSQFAELGLKALYINHTFDTRTTTNFSTHSPIVNFDKIDGISLVKVFQLKELDRKTFSKYDIVAIDEAQFFGPELIPFVKELVDGLKKYVIVTGLDGTFHRDRFGHILDLIPLADSVLKLTAICKNCVKGGCFKNAIFTHRIGTGKEVVDVGGADKYEAVCRDCYLSFNSQKQHQEMLEKSFC